MAAFQRIILLLIAIYAVLSVGALPLVAVRGPDDRIAPHQNLASRVITSVTTAAWRRYYLFRRTWYMRQLKTIPRTPQQGTVQLKVMAQLRSVNNQLAPRGPVAAGLPNAVPQPPQMEPQPANKPVVERWKYYTVFRRGDMKLLQRPPDTETFRLYQERALDLLPAVNDNIIQLVPQVSETMLQG